MGFVKRIVKGVGRFIGDLFTTPKPPPVPQAPQAPNRSNGDEAKIRARLRQGARRQSTILTTGLGGLDSTKTRRPTLGGQ